MAVSPSIRASCGCLAIALMQMIVITAVTARATMPDCADVPSVVVPVGDRALCLYGHWIKGDVLVEVVDGRVCANGIVVYPRIDREPVDAGRSRAAEDPCEADFERISAECLRYQVSLYASGLTKSEVVAMAIDWYEEQDLVAGVRDIQGGDFYEISYCDGRTANVAIGLVLKRPDAETLAEQRCRDLRMAFDGFVARARDGWLQIISTAYSLWAPPSRRGDLEIARALDLAIESGGDISEDQWPFTLIGLEMAREIGRPLPLSKCMGVPR